MSQMLPYLEKWIQNKLDAYEEKPRKGISRGEPHGIPRHKYHAALLHVGHTKELSLRQIAKRARVSYELLLKWRTEDRFRELKMNAIEEYTLFLGRTKIYGENVDPVAGDYRQFIREEVMHYTLLLWDSIREHLVNMWDEWFSEIESSEHDRSLKKISMHFQKTFAFIEGFAAARFGVVPLDKQKGPGILHGELEHLRGLARMREKFMVALDKGWKKQATVVFDVVLNAAKSSLLERIATIALDEDLD